MADSYILIRPIILNPYEIFTILVPNFVRCNMLKLTDIFYYPWNYLQDHIYTNTHSIFDSILSKVKLILNTNTHLRRSPLIDISVFLKISFSPASFSQWNTIFAFWPFVQDGMFVFAVIALSLLLL